MTALTIIIDQPIIFAVALTAALAIGTSLSGVIGNWYAERSPDNHWRTAYHRETDKQIQALKDGRCPTCGTPYTDMPDPDPNERLDTP